MELEENECSHNIRMENNRTRPSWGELGLAELELGLGLAEPPRPGSVRLLAFVYFVCLSIPLFLACLRHFASQFCLYEGVIFSSSCLMMESLYLMVALLLVELEKAYRNLRTEQRWS